MDHSISAHLRYYGLSFPRLSSPDVPWTALSIRSPEVAAVLLRLGQLLDAAQQDIIVSDQPGQDQPAQVIPETDVRVGVEQYDLRGYVQTTPGGRGEPQQAVLQRVFYDVLLVRPHCERGRGGGRKNTVSGGDRTGRHWCDKAWRYVVNE